MKILIICPTFPLISETFVLNHITGLIELGHRVEILAKHRGPKDSPLQPEVSQFGLLEKTTYLAGPPSFRGAQWREIVSRMGWSRWTKPRARRYDIIHAHFGPGGLLGLSLRQLGQIRGKLVVSFHGFDLSRELKKKKPIDYHPLFREADLFLPVSSYFRRRLEALGCPSSKIRVHPVAVDLLKFPKPRSRGPVSVLKLISVARLVEKKGLEYSIHAVASLLQAGVRLEYRIIGRGELHAKLEALIGELGVATQVRLLGAKLQPEVSDHLGEADLFLAPSVTAADGDEEGIPTCILEAMACGLPVISTLHSGIPEVVEEGITGFLVPERNSEALATAITRFVEAPELGAALGARGRSFIEENRDLQKINFRMQQIYEALLAPRPRKMRPDVSKGETDSAHSPKGHFPFPPAY